MGKQGPCYHCGIHSTPLWRNGPPTKPVLCNACGSRYRNRGSLDNYAPKHAQTQPIAKRPRISSNKHSNHNGNLRAEQSEDLFTNDGVCYSTNSDEFTSDKPSSDHSPVSNPRQNSYENVEEGNVNEIQDEVQGNLWKSSRKRSLVAYRRLTPIERLQRDLYRILKNHSILSETEEDLLIYNANNPQICCNEIGLGSILLHQNAMPFKDSKANNCYKTAIVVKFDVFAIITMKID
ncbi:GATA transcription factor 26-like [Mercurialis annua]|uniref:GATA transcription factor 26-like n=1 Tax=Mercurialis annua TaxID=3986 RepID=UPI0024AED64D|nr:GATA transcription factor 26-like [Mercurialis annua]